MSELSQIKKQMSKVENLERRLHLKQLQVNSLLSITQAINNNLSAEGLYEMYGKFINFDLSINKVALFMKCEEGNWHCASQVNVDHKSSTYDLSKLLPAFSKPGNIQSDSHPFFGQFDIVIPVKHKDMPLAYVFIGDLDDEVDEDVYSKIQFITAITNIVAVAIENKRLFKRQLEQERLKKEMSLAADIQDLLIPESFPKSQYYGVAGIYKPHYAVGGDYFDFVELEEGKFTFCIGDISGKGLGAALLMANLQAHFQTLIKRRCALETLVRDLNIGVFNLTKGERHFTFFIAEYDIAKKELQYITAGHNPPILVNDGHLEWLDKGCTILGCFSELPYVETGEVHINGDSCILSFTDGLTDIKNPQGEFLEEDKLSHFVQGHYLLSADDFNNELQHFIEDFTQGMPYPDDFTVLSCRIFDKEYEEI